MAYALGTPAENSGVAGAASLATSTALNCALHDSIIVFTLQDTTHTTTLSDTALNAYTQIGSAALFSQRLYAYICQNSAANAANTVSGSSNGSDLSGIWAVNASGLVTTGGVLASAFLGQNGPGNGLNTVTAGAFNIPAIPALLIGFAVDNTGTNVPAAGTLPNAFTGLGGVWGNKTGGVQAQAEHCRITLAGSAGATFGSTAGGASHGGDLFISCGLLIAEIGAVSTGIFSGITRPLTQALTTSLTSGVNP